MEYGGFCELLVDSIRSLFISLNAIKRTEVLDRRKGLNSTAHIVSIKRLSRSIPLVTIPIGREMKTADIHSMT